MFTENSLCDFSSINTYLNSYQKLREVKIEKNCQKLVLPKYDQYIIIRMSLSVDPLLGRIRQNQSENFPLFSLNQWSKLHGEIRQTFVKKFNIKVNQISSGSIVKLKSWESINIRTDHYCLFPHNVFTTLIPLNRF